MNEKTMKIIMEGDCLVQKIVIFSGIPNPEKHICKMGDRLFDRFFYVTKGTFYLTNKSGTSIQAKAGEIVYLPADVEYESCWDADVKGGYISFAFLLMDSEGEHLNLAEEAIIVANDKKGDIKTLFENALRYYIQHDKFVSLRLKSLFYRIAYSVFRQLDHKNYTEEGQARAIYKAMIYLDDHYMTKVTTEELASMCNLSVASFRRYFKEYNQTSPLKYKNHLRMRHAREMLSSGYYTASEVSDIVGCTDLSHFNKLYRSEFGINPSDEIPSFD